jgi:hypothetical protein
VGLIVLPINRADRGKQNRDGIHIKAKPCRSEDQLGKLKASKGGKDWGCFHGGNPLILLRKLDFPS